MFLKAVLLFTVDPENTLRIAYYQVQPFNLHDSKITRLDNDVSS